MPSVKAVAPLTLDSQNFLEPDNNSEFAIFIGPQKSFTHTILRIVDEEIEDILPVRHETVPEFLAALGTMTSAIRLVIVDASVCDTVLQDVQNLANSDATQFPHQQLPSIVVAYWNEAEARSVYERIGGHEVVHGFLPMNQSIDIWLAVMRLFLIGGSYYPRKIHDMTPRADSANAAKPVEAPAETGKELLTQREIAVMQEVVNGMQNKQIAAHLNVSEHTIKLHIHHIITKLQVSNRTAAAMKFVEMQKAARV
ncbi:MAG: response regulator transcription factor [Pseudomonadota bacterium]|nr:response regulator transcription factor [Pseudomonadota bacterium]